MGQYLFVNADDFGMCKSANDAIFDLFENGYLKSSTIMMTCPAAKEAVQYSIDNPQYAIGVHLTTTSEWHEYRWKALTNGPSLHDKDGYMWATGEDADRYVSNTDQIKSLGNRELYRVVDTALNEYINSTSIDEVYSKLFDVWNYPSKNPITIEKFEYVRPSDIGKPEHSTVVSSSFHTYYYYKVVVDIVGRKVEFIYTVAEYYSGGWN